MWGVDDFFNSEWIAATLFDHQAVQHNASHFPHHEILTEYERQVFEHEGEFAATEQDLIFEPIDLDTQSRWREGALRVIEIHDRFRQNFPNSFYALWATERDEARRTWNRRFVKLLAMTRQVLTGAHNMLGSPGPSRDPDSIVRRATRRILLAHNVKIMRELWLEYRQGGTDDYAGRLLRNDPSWDHIMELANPLQIDTDGVEVSRDQLEQLISAFDPPKPSSPGRKGESWDSPRGRMVYAAQDLGERLRSIVPFFMKPGPLSIADSIILRDLRGLVRGSLLTIEYGVGLGVFRDHDRSHQMALSMTDGLLRGINETQDPTETTQGVRGFWADSKQWSEDLQLALCEEQILLDDAQVRVPDDMWHLFEFLDRLHPWIDRQHENPTWAASSQDRPALEEGVQGLWRVYRRRPWAGPLSPVFGRALDRLKDVMHQYSNREMTVGLGVPEWRGRRWSERLGDVARTNGPPEYRPLDGYGGPADLTYVRLFHEHQQAECIRMLQQGEEVSYRVRRRLQITEAMMHLQIRLLVPDVHDGEDNSEMTRRVWEFCRRVRRGEGDDGQFPQWSRGDASLYEVLIHHLLDAATHREETNPTQATVMPAVWRGFVALYQQTAQELEAARVSDAGFLVGIRHALVQHEEELCARWGFDEWQGYGLMALLDQASRCVVLAESEEWMRQQAWGRVFVGEFWQMYRLRKNLDGEMAWGAYRGVRVVAAMARVDGIVQRLIGAMAGPSNDRAALERRCVQVTGIALEDIPRPRGRHGVVDHGGWFEFAVGG
ncbi:hypothetical protein Tdes44962_MAKER04033 [Teratosphaeria destructans]|uniref:Uncharacterized protein n=1 Tax=Teratosphaeria destructans TaxID=418781 RepID=A0A9W7W0G7_9PEZI|nr:hypothetical protein Tdes44962_MAKER04033 [Teratosphaeria destructans]